MSPVASIAARAAEAGLTFLVAGGHAVIAHGYARNTFDLDLIICRTQEEQWRQVLTTSGYSLLHRGPTFLQFNPPDSRSLPVDLMLVGEDTFAKLIREATPLPDWGCGNKVVSLRHLLALKCHAIRHGHQGRIVKDADDVIALVKVNRVDVEDSEIRALFLKHGTDEFYEKVRRLAKST
jgi:hypothetical protein